MAGDLNFTVDFQTQQAASQIVSLFNKFKAGSQEAGKELNALLGGTVEKKVQIRFEKDDSGIKQIAANVVEIRSELDKLDKAYNKINKTQPGSLTNLKQSLAEATQARNAIAQFGSTIDLVNKKQLLTSQQTQAFTEADARVKQLQRSLDNLRVANLSGFEKLSSDLGFDKFLSIGGKIQDVVTIFQSLGIAIGAITAPIKAATNALADLQSFELTFAAIGQGATGATQALNESSRIALGLGTNILSVRDAFRQLSPVILASKDASGQASNTLDDVSSVVEALSSRFAVFGLSAEKSQRVFNGIVQAFGKGRLAAEELTQQISEADPAFKTDFAGALYAARDALGELGTQVDGTVKNLDELVASGQITSDVLLKVIPGISKSSELFGKLGTSALSAVAALERGDVTITQVRNQLASLNQLTLERLAKSAEPLVNVLLKIQATFTDFATAVSKLEGTKSLLNLLGKIGQAFQRLLEVVLLAAQGFLTVLGPILQFANALASIPGVLELVGLAVLVKLLKPLEKFSNVIRKVKTNAANDFKAVAAEAISMADKTKKAVDTVNKLETESVIKPKLVADIGDVQINKTGKTPSIEVELQANDTALRKSLLDRIKNTEEYQALLERRIPLQEKLDNNLARQKQNLDKIVDLERKRNILQGQLDNPKVTGARRDEAKLNLGETKKELAALNTSQRNLTSSAAEYTRELDDINQRLDGANTRVDRQIAKLREVQQIQAANAGKFIPDTGEEGRYARELKDVTKADNLAKTYYNNIIRGEKEIAVAKDKNIQKMDKLISQLERRRQYYLDLGKSAEKQAGGQVTDESADARTRYEELTKAQNKVIDTKQQYVNSIEREIDALSDLKNATKEQGDTLTTLQKKEEAAVNVLKQRRDAYKQLSSSIKTLEADNRILINTLDAEKAKLNELRTSRSYGAPDSDEIKASELMIQKLTNSLADNQQKLDDSRGALQSYKNGIRETVGEINTLRGSIDYANSGFGRAKAGVDAFRQSLLKKIELNFGGTGTNLYKTFDLAFNRIGQGVDGLQRKLGQAKNAFKDFGAGLKALGAEFGLQIAIAAGAAILTKAWNDATAKSRKIAEDAAAGIAEITAAQKDLTNALERGAGIASANSTVIQIDPKAINDIKGAEAAMLAIGDTVDGLGKVISAVFGAGFNLIGKAASGASGPVLSFGQAVVGVAANMGTFAATAAILGGIIGGVIGSALGPGAAATAALGAKIGAVVGTIAGAIVSWQSLDRVIKENSKSANAYIAAVKDKTNAVIGFIAKLKESIQAQKAANDEAARLRAQGAPQSDIAAQENKAVQAEAAGINAFAAISKEIENTRSQLNNYNEALAETRTRLAELKKQRDAAGAKPGFAGPEARAEYERLKKEVAFTEAAYGDLNNIVITLNRSLAQQEAALAAASAGLDENVMAAVNSQNSLNNLNSRLTTLEQSLGALDQTMAPETFNRIAQAAGGLKGQIDLLNNSANSQRMIGYINEISNAFSNGTAVQSIANLKLQLDALNNYVVTLQVDSAQFEEAIGRIGQAVDATEEGQRRIQAANKTSNQLQIGIAQAQLQLEQSKVNTQLQGIQRADQEASRAHSRRMQELDLQSQRVRDRYDAEINRLREMTPAEQALYNLRKQQLAAQAAYGATEEERLNARAQLERMAADEKIKSLEKSRDTELDGIEKTKQAEQEKENARREELQRTTDALNEQLQGLQNALQQLQDTETLSQLKADIEALEARQKTYNKELQGTVEGSKKVRDNTGEYADKLKKANDQAGPLSTKTEKIRKDMALAATSSGTFASNMERAAIASQQIKVPTRLPGQPRWAGGPVKSSETYIVNELGREGFMDRSGKVTPINKPRYGEWRPPSSGTVIPAHIFKEMQMNRRKVSSPTTNNVTYRTSTVNKRLANVSGEITMKNAAVSPARSEFGSDAQYQSMQAKQLNKLANAIQQLNEKNWNIQVNLRNTGSTAYFDSLNRVI